MPPTCGCVANTPLSITAMRTPRPVGTSTGSDVEVTEDDETPTEVAGSGSIGAGSTRPASAGTAGAHASTVRSIASEGDASDRTGSEGRSGGIRGEQLGETAGF